MNQCQKTTPNYSNSNSEGNKMVILPTNRKLFIGLNFQLSTFIFHLSSFSFPLSSFHFKLLTFIFFLTLSSVEGFSQAVSINPTGAYPDPSAMLDVSSTEKGFLPPRLTTTQMNAVSSPAAGLLIYNITNNQHYFFDGSSWQSLKNSQADSAAVPVGTILPFGADSSKVPNGFLLCDGASLSTTTYSDLFGVIGYSWGGSGSSFNLPDLRGRFLRGTDYGAGNDPDRAIRTALNTGGNTGDKVGSAQADELKSHSHDIRTNSADGSGTGIDNASNAVTTTITDKIQSAGGNETRPINVNVNYIICYSSNIAASAGSGTFQGSVPAASLPSAVLDSSRLADSDNDTKIKVEESADEDVIRFDVSGSEIMKLDSIRLHMNDGLNSVYIGTAISSNLTTGYANVGVGYNTLFNTSTGYGNTALGFSAMSSNSSGRENVAIGRTAMPNNTTADYNVAIGTAAMQQSQTGNSNTAVGWRAAFTGNGASNNTSIGNSALHDNVTGTNNVSLGNSALRSSLGSNNVGIGSNSGFSTIGSGNVFLGYQAGYSETGSNKLYIENSNSSSPLIWGDFATDSVIINGNLSSTNGLIIENGIVGIGTLNPLTLGGHSDNKIGVSVSTGSARMTLHEQTDDNHLTIGVHDGGLGGASFLFSTKAMVFGTKGTERVIFDSTGYVGIGTQTPIQKLDIRGSNTDDAGIITFGNSDRSHFMQLFPGRLNDPNPFIQWKSGDPLRFTNDAFGFSELMRISEFGHLGIGTDNVVQQIDVLDTNATEVGIRLGADQTDQYVQLDYNVSGAFSSLQSGNYSGTTHNLVLQGGGSNVGVGTTTPNKNLDVAGTFGFSGVNSIPNVGVEFDLDVSNGSHFQRDNVIPLVIAPKLRRIIGGQTGQIITITFTVDGADLQIINDASTGTGDPILIDGLAQDAIMGINGYRALILVKGVNAWYLVTTN